MGVIYVLQDIIRKLGIAISTLNELTVSGEDNLDRLLDSIQILHSVVDKLKEVNKGD